MNILKTKTECYKLRHPSKSIWADISIDAGERSGSISIISDFGNWSNSWGASGEFKKFLTGIDMYYAAGKFGCGRYLDVDKTVKMYKRLLFQSRRQEDIDEDDARLIFNEIIELEKSVANGQDDAFNCVIWNSFKLVSFLDDMPETCTDVHPMFKRFWDEIWPFFVEKLKAEINEAVTA